MSDSVPDIAEALEVRTRLEDQYQQATLASYDVIRASVLKYGRLDYLMEHVLGYTVTPCHLSMLIHQSSNNKTLTLAPRGIGKSVCLTIIRAIYEILINPNIRILIVSNTQLQAEIFLREIKDHLKSNEKLTSIFGEQAGEKWDSREINVKNRTTFAKEIGRAHV